MTAHCAAPGCEEIAAQRCARCRSIRYCSRDCQRMHWAIHKDDCAAMAAMRAAEEAGIDPSQPFPHGRSSVNIVTIFDTRVIDGILPIEEIPPSSGGQGWELCPLVNLLGVPLAIKKVSPCVCQVCAGPQSTVLEPMKQVATRLAIEAHNGLAPPRWQGGGFNHLGTVAAARTDGHDFTGRDWAVLDDYIYNQIFDVWGMDPLERQQRLPFVYSREAYARYLAMRGEEGGVY